MRVEITDQVIEIRLARWQKILGLMRDIRVPLADISDISVVEKPVSEAMRTGIKVGLRLPWLYFVARTIKLDEAFIVSRKVPALSFVVERQPPLRRVLVSTPDADQLAQRLGAR